MAKATGKSNWAYSGIPGLTVGENPTMKAIRKKYPKLDKNKDRVTTLPIREGKPYNKTKEVNKLYKTY